MPTKITIAIKDIVVQAELSDTRCAEAILNALPIEARPNEWGDEFYFTIPVEFDLDETATSEVKIGDIGYWPPGRALAIFFGPTPLSSGSEPVPASKVNIVGRITDDPGVLKKARGAKEIKIKQT
ncbi:MAG TPA: cyclophilin-like fold protein [Syntrophorhabdaceae bacterium]|nr:cyclophilin-like fold protein [Syntrophorhabdaceae bacterium]HOL06057.1 cyclophilin-like fold protein [Syntrophorhabdaceae bacterium]HPP41500.1 cyclophilin-like fold protein [Syntrophorhabdaceae bacterium]HQK46990.1 cyclophilin-like fold protein [Syntrophorhabdaceae bacterium]HRR72238.1 cyclophilin-like fold protein [Syntrophorhabdaceae bacterium]